MDICAGELTSKAFLFSNVWLDILGDDFEMLKYNLLDSFCWKWTKNWKLLYPRHFRCSAMRQKKSLGSYLLQRIIIPIFFLIFVSIYEYIKSMFFCFDLNFYRLLISSIFIQKPLIGTKFIFVFTVCYFHG